ncbi:glycosyltransferase family 87 protein [Nocardioides sp.]|uniref:glycosyltransferase family 87 protein n=1 Tax=Nocardioides sp. TaxID=35761 RepID=UPI002732C460|nr:glycosyltransferase 87 family protein [Nocardioides sp.]MDP3893969.1 glycosyltransferase 87 family protein [Nocardioides sp.]
MHPPSEPTGRVHPTRDDPVVAALAEGVGGPAGSRLAPHRWWTPVRVLLALTALAFALGMLQKSPCFEETWSNGDQRYSQMCYSDVPYLYTGRGLAELSWPYTDDEQTRGRHPVMEYPVGIAYAAWGAAWVTHWIAGSPDIEPRFKMPVEELFTDESLEREIGLYVVVTTIALGLATLLATWFLTGVNPRRPWDAAGFAVAPVLVLSGLVNWDLYAVALVAGALWAWARGRPVLTGVMIGLGTATKLYPLFLLGGILVICLRRRGFADLLRVVAAAAAAWLLVNLPALLTGPAQWKVFWTFNSDRGADLGSWWLVAQQASGTTIGATLINQWSLVIFAIWCLAVLVLGLLAPSTPRLAQLGFLIVAGFLLMNKVYSPQFVLWLLPLAVLARPRWRDLLIWQAGEVFYFAAVWWYLGGFLAPGGGGDAGFYWLAIVLRLVAQLYLVTVVARDVLRPAYDVVEREPPRRMRLLS